MKKLLILFLSVLSQTVFLHAQQNDDFIKWHYDVNNKVMKEGHRQIREYQKQLEEERIKAVQEDILLHGGPGDTLPAPTLLGTEEIYASGMLKGKWRMVSITHGNAGGGYGSGVRVDRTVYDPDHNKIYTLNESGNLSDGSFVHRGALVTRNQLVKITKGGFSGIKNTNGKFRLIGAINGEFRYSDDEGMTWIRSAGGAHNIGAAYWTEGLINGVILARIRKNINGADNDVILRSTDYGKTYSQLQAWPVSQSDGIVSTKLYNTNDYCYFIRKVKGQGTWEIYRYENGSFGLLTSVSNTGIPACITGTFLSVPKVYVGISGGGGYYSDGGTVFQFRAGLRSDITTMSPTDVQWLMSRSATHEYSSDGGNTWASYPNQNNTIGWDPKHITFYKVGGVWTLTAANDMGLCFNSNPNPLNTSSWKYVNDNHTYAILHGGTAVDNTGVSITNNQDPGTYELLATGNGTYSGKNKTGADGLRSTASNGGKAYWFRHYWDSFYHNHASFTNDNRQATHSITATWYTPPFKGSTTPGEDAIYVSGYDNLIKLTYNTGSNSISRTNLPYNFKTQAGDITYGVGVSKSDPNRLYVATKNKRFYYSTDKGNTWTETAYAGTKPTPQTSPAWNQSTGFYIEVADENPDLVFWGAGSGSAACLVSKDGGKTFTSTVNGLPSNESVKTLSLSPDGKLAFSSNYYMYVASDNKWYSMKGKSLPTGANASGGVYYLPLQNKVRYFTWGAGVVDFDITYLNTTDHPFSNFSPDSCYKITARHSGKVLEVAGASTAAGANVQQSAWAGSDNQKWKFTFSDGFYQVTNINSGKALEVTGSGTTDGVNVQQGNAGTGDNQKWNVLRNSSGYYALAAKHSIKVLDVAGNSTANGANVQQMTSINLQNQQWTISSIPGCLATGIMDDLLSSADGFTVYPNPSKGSITISFTLSQSANTEMALYDMLGKTVKVILNTQKLSSGEYNYSIDVSSLEPGVYLCKLNTDGVVTSKMLVKE